MPNPNPNNSRQEWEQLYHNLSQGLGGLRTDFAPVPPKVTPLVNDPKCEEHCKRHFVERVIECGTCGAKPYQIVCHEWPWSEGHYWHAIEPRNGAPEYRKACPSCGGAI